jgi:hypothetical protein
MQRQPQRSSEKLPINLLKKLVEVKELGKRSWRRKTGRLLNLVGSSKGRGGRGGRGGGKGAGGRQQQQQQQLSAVAAE